MVHPVPALTDACAGSRRRLAGSRQKWRERDQLLAYPPKASLSKGNAIRIALNGLGRIGKLVLRDLIDAGAGGEIVLLNDPVGDELQRHRTASR